MKKYKIVFICLFLCFCCIAQAQLLWEITGNKMKNKSYLFGTHHLIGISFLDSVQGIYSAYNESKCVVGEIIMENEPDIAQKMLEASTMQQSVRNFFSTEAYNKLDSVLFSTLNMGLSEMDHFKPAMIEYVFTLTFYDKYFKIDKDNFQIDSFFQKMGAIDKKKLLSLESADEQIDLLFNKMPLKRQAESLYETVIDINSTLATMQKINHYYRIGNLDSLLLLSRSDSLKWRLEYEKIILNDRNERWVERLPDMMKKSSCFIAVGALHLPGDDGLIALLRKAGFKVRPVR